MSCREGEGAGEPLLWNRRWDIIREKSHLVLGWVVALVYGALGCVAAGRFREDVSVRVIWSNRAKQETVRPITGAS